MNLVLLNRAGARETLEWFLTKCGLPSRRKCGTIFGFLCFFGFLMQWTSGSEEALPPPCDNNIYCYGELLHTVQMAHLYPDSKTFVDMKLKLPANDTLRQFQVFLEKTNYKPTSYDLEGFVREHFDPAGSEFEEWIPTDWIEKPKFLRRIKDHNYRNWAYQLNLLWKMLGKKMKNDVKLNPEFYSIIYVPHPVIVPGGRFREFYYWDSYWIVKGLLLSEMYDTVKGMLENFLSIIERFGHIPNGGRVYYLARSQPPMLVPMISCYLQAKNDTEFLKNSLPILEMEFSYWLTNHSIIVNKGDVNYTLFRYMDRSVGPRPESYREDFISASIFKTEREKLEHYSQLKAGAESGWDFSSRWFIKNGTNKGNLTDIKTKQIIPVDLNAILYWNAQLLSKFFKMVGNHAKASYYNDHAADILEAVTKILWLDEVGAWLDYDLINEKERDYFYPTNIAPLWTGCYDRGNKEYIVGKVMKYIQDKQIMVTFLGGIPTTLEHTNEQWDYPNAWPPLQHMMIMGLLNTGDDWARELGFEIANRWVKSNYVAYNDTGHMYEKYDAMVVGGHGTGGEYDVQLGFGWTNGVIMDLLHIFGDKLSSTENEFESSLLLSSPENDGEGISSASTSDGLVFPLVITAVIFIGIFAGGSIWLIKARNSSERSDLYRRFYRNAEYTELRNFTIT